MPTSRDVRNATTERFVGDTGTAGITRVRVPGSAMDSISDRQPVSAALRGREIKISQFATNAPVEDLIAALGAYNIQVAFRFQKADSSVVLQRPMPFTTFNGTFGDLLNALRTGMGIVSWQEGDIIYLSDADRYAVTLPQNDAVMKDVSATLTALGATEIVSSVDGGKIIYTATPTLQDEVLSPFLKRAARNLSTINLQVAVVSLSLTDKSSQGFDWSKFSAMIDTRGEAISAAGGNAVDTSVPQSAGNPGISVGETGSIVDLTQDALFLGTTNLGTIFGTKAVTSITSAIGYLSTFGNANVTQNVELKTLSGKPVTFRTGQEIPYVSDVGAVASDSTVTGSVETDKVETGLKVEMTPRFDAEAEVVTVEVDMELSEVIEFVELSAGNQIGSLTQPRTQKQELNDIVQMRAGQTVIIGGLQYDREQFNGNEPTFLRNTTRKGSFSTGKRDQDVSRSSLFIILRPSVTVYEPGLTAVSSAGATK